MQTDAISSSPMPEAYWQNNICCTQCLLARYDSWKKSTRSFPDKEFLHEPSESLGISVWVNNRNGFPAKNSCLHDMFHLLLGSVFLHKTILQTSAAAAMHITHSRTPKMLMLCHSKHFCNAAAHRPQSDHQSPRLNATSLWVVKSVSLTCRKSMMPK